MCDELPEVDPNAKAWVALVAPEFAHVPVRELAEKTALEVFGRAAAAGWGSIDLFTHDVFRDSCVFYLPSDTLRAVNTAFEVELITAISGKDKDGRDFRMRGILAGRGKLIVFYDRDGIVYRKEREPRDFVFASRVDFNSPVSRRLENVHGVCVKVLLLGCVGIRSMVKDGDLVSVRAGIFTSESPPRPIRVRGAAGGAN